MGKYLVLRTKWFIEKYEQLTLFEKQRLERFAEQLSENGEMVGKPLGYIWFREKRFNGNRMYFLVYLEWKAVLLVTISDKKDQQEEIDGIMQNFEVYKRWVENALKSMNFI